MLFDLVEVGSLGGILIEDFIDKLLYFIAEIIWVCALAFDYLLIGDVFIFCLKWRRPTRQLI